MAKFFINTSTGDIFGRVREGGSGRIPTWLKAAGTAPDGDAAQEIVPNTVDASQEKHVPVILVEGNIVTVKVGSAAHPMTAEHLIEWIYIQTKKGGQRKALKAGDTPEARFALTDDDAPVAAYAYCNLHGLWKADA